MSDLKQKGSGFLQDCSLAELSSCFLGWQLEDRYPHLLYEESEAPSFVHPADYDVRTVDPSGAAAIQAFLDLNTEDDIDDALIDIEDPDEEIRMAYYGCRGIQ